MRARPRLEEHAVSPGGDARGDQDVVEDRVVGHGLEQVAADGVNRAGRPHRRVDRGFAPPDELLVTPVEPDPLTHRRAFGVLGQDQLPTDRAHAWVGEGSDQRA